MEGEIEDSPLCIMDPVIASIWQLIKDEIFSVPSQPDGRHPYLNPYRDSLPGVEHPQAASIRQQNLQAYLEHFKHKPATLILGEAPGWRGCRFSGVAFTCEAQLTSGELPFRGKRSSLADPLHGLDGNPGLKAHSLATGYREASAAIFWRCLLPYAQDFLVWNIFPFHPHQPGEPLTNRRPVISEGIAHIQFLEKVIERLQPVDILAVGRYSQAILWRSSIPHHPIRHPSYGGARQFETQVLAHFEKSLSRRS